MKAVIIFNPFAGRRRAIETVRCAAAVMRSRGWAADVQLTQQPGQMSALAADSVSGGVDAVFAAGGDGTVGAVAEALAGSQAIMGVLPVGTANIWAVELGFKTRLKSDDDVRACIESQLDGSVRAVDMGRYGDRKFLLWAGVGLDAHVISKVEPRPEFAKRFGNFYYLVAGLIRATDFRGTTMTVRADSGVMNGMKLLALVTNVRLYAGTESDSLIDPSARADDGLFDVWTMAGESYFDAIAQLIRFRLGQHLHHPTAEKLRARELEVELERPMLLQLDGEVAGRVNRAHLSVWPRALRVFAPRRPLAILGELDTDEHGFTGVNTDQGKTGVNRRSSVFQESGCSWRPRYDKRGKHSEARI